MKATLDGKSEVPANTSAGTGTADIDYDAATKKLTWKLTYSGLSGPATAAHFHGPAEAGKNAGVAVAIPNATSSPAEGSATLTDAQAADLDGRQVLCQRPHRGQSGRRNPRPGDEVSFVRGEHRWLQCKRADACRRPPILVLHAIEIRCLARFELSCS